MKFKPLFFIFCLFCVCYLKTIFTREKGQIIQEIFSSSAAFHLTCHLYFYYIENYYFLK